MRNVCILSCELVFSVELLVRRPRFPSRRHHTTLHLWCSGKQRQFFLITHLYAPDIICTHWWREWNWSFIGNLTFIYWILLSVRMVHAGCKNLTSRIVPVYVLRISTFVLTVSVPPYSSVPPDGPPSYSSLQIPGDSELDVEHDLPPLEAIIPKEHLRKLDKKEKKRQEVINGNDG